MLVKPRSTETNLNPTHTHVDVFKRRATRQGSFKDLTVSQRVPLFPSPREVVKVVSRKQRPHSPRFFMGVDGKSTLRSKEPPDRDGLKTTEVRDVRSKKSTQETIQSREKGISGLSKVMRKVYPVLICEH